MLLLTVCFPIRWFPNHERATAVGLSMGGFQLGNVVGLVLAPLLMQSIGISGPFVLFTALGLLWLVTWSFKVTNDPQDSGSISNSELRLIQAGKADSSAIKGSPPPLRLLLSKLPTWAIIFANITNNWVRFLFSFRFYFFSFEQHNERRVCYPMQGYFVLLSWMPVYFKTVSFSTTRLLVSSS